MSQVRTNETRTYSRQEHKQTEIVTTSFTKYIDDTTDPDETDLTDEDSIDAPPEANEESDDENGGEDYAAPESFSIQPIWILYEGQILWGASRYGFNIAPKEYFRRRIQTLLDFLAERFPDRNYGELLLSLQGFFAKDSESSKRGWLESLKNSGILYFDERTEKFCVMSIANLRAGKGQGKILPGKLESLWLESELAKIDTSSGSKDFKKYKAALTESYKKFCADLNEMCGIFASHEEEGADKSKISSIGLKKIEFVYEERTLANKISEWKKKFMESEK